MVKTRRIALLDHDTEAAASEDVADSKAVLDAFFAAFNRHDAETMAAAYLPDGSFEDPVFGKLSGSDAGWMWRMLLANTNLTVEHTATATKDGGVVDWIARYTYATADEKAAGKPGRPVENHVRSTVTLVDGRIVKQVDVFSFPRWARQALPLTAAQRLMTYVPPLASVIRKVVRKGASDALAVFKRKSHA